MASPFSAQFTVEIEHDGQRKLLRSDAENQRVAEREFQRVADHSNGAITVDGTTLKKHATSADATVHVRDWRVARGKTPEPTAEELAANGKATFPQPAAAE